MAKSGTATRLADAGRGGADRVRTHWVRAGRVRRPADLLFAVLSLAVVAVVLGSIHSLPLGSTELADDVSSWLTHIPAWLKFPAEVVSGVGCFVLGIVAVVMLIRDQWRDVRNAVTAGIAGAAGALIASSLWRAEHGAVERAVLHHTNPSLFVVDTAFIAFVVGTDLTRRSHWSRWWPTAGAALLISGLAVNELTPFAVVIVLFSGLLAGWLVRWIFGAATVLPDQATLTTWLTSQGAGVGELAGTGRVRLAGSLTDGTPIQVRLAGRDTRGSGLARRLWSVIRLQPAASGHVAIGSRSQLEQIALACALAQQASVPSPAVRLLGEMPGETLVLVTIVPSEPKLTSTSPNGTAPPGSTTASSTTAGPITNGAATAGAATAGPVTVAGATALFASLRALHDAGIAHRDLRPENIFVTPRAAGFLSLDAALPGASELARRLDLAQALATLAQAVGPSGAIAALRAGYGHVDENAVAAVLQPVALAPWGWRAMRAAQGSLNEVRQELVGPGTAAPPARLERFKWRTVLTTVALAVAAYLLIGEISGNVLGTLGHANPGWFALAIVASAVTYLAAAENLAAFVPQHLSLMRGWAVQLSTAFVGIAMPPTVGHVAVNARYLHREKVDDSTIAAAVAMSQVVNIVTTVLLLIVFGLLTGSGLSKFHIAPGADLIIGLVAIAAVIIILLAVPQTRGKLATTVWPWLRSIGPRLLDAVSHPLRLALSAAANLVLTFSYLVAFIAALHAVGAHPAILPAAVVYLAGNAVGAAAPTPGGIGGVEAVLAAGLTAIGIPAHEAIPAVLLFRVATFWLPIPAGWVSYVLLQRRGIL
jgi:glycosyltransferase 2 family protein